MDEELLRAFCLGNYSSTDFQTNGAHGSDPDNSTDSQRRLKVLGDDGREVTTSTDYPYRAVLYLSFTNGDGGSSRCTATMISPYWAITAAHCVYGGGDWYSNWKLYKNVRRCW